MSHHNRGTWRQDHELELLAVLRQMGADELRQAKRLIGRELALRGQQAAQHTTAEAERALFHA